jgi:predicted Zn-dependent protease
MSTTEERLEQAKVLLQSGDGEAGRVILLEILKAEPNNHAALMMLGGDYFANKKYAEAEMVFERLQQTLPGSGPVSIALFNTLMKQGRHEEAADEIRRFIGVADKVAERETIEHYTAIIEMLSEGATGLIPGDAANDE